MTTCVMPPALWDILCGMEVQTTLQNGGIVFQKKKKYLATIAAHTQRAEREKSLDSPGRSKQCNHYSNHKPSPLLIIIIYSWTSS